MTVIKKKSTGLNAAKLCINTIQIVMNRFNVNNWLEISTPGAKTGTSGKFDEVKYAQRLGFYYKGLEEGIKVLKKVRTYV